MNSTEKLGAPTMTDVELQQDARMDLASVGSATGGGDSGTHKASMQPWTTASGIADELQHGMQTALQDLEHAHDGIKSGTAGFTSASSLAGILGGWQSRLSAVRDHCAHLEGSLKKAGVNFGENEAHVKASFDAASTRSKIDDYSK
ncbi:hypothetical protein ACFY2W_32625 [Streptomyces sp. NPDC001262]|uniref:hypothetical protein n=1 Tax=unclassified Streptomyces TaxID=2593676 RepID=UPI003695E225